MTANAHRTTAAARRLPLTLTFLLLASTFPLSAQVVTAPKTSLQKFKFTAPSIKPGAELRWEVAKGGKAEVEKDEYAILQNDVRLYYQDITIRADKVTANLKTKDVVAEGNVIIDQGPTRVTASQAVFNLDSKTGTFFNSTATLEPTLYFAGEKVEKISDDTYRLTNGLFTSCDLDRPAWSFHVKSADITLDSYAHMKDVSFRARRVPIFWTPRLVWPTKRDRSQGLLIPRLLLSGRFGSRLELGYFLPFGDSFDTTFYADLNTKGYNGAGANIRYAPSNDVKLGNMSAYAVHDVANHKEQWKYQYQHSQENLPGGFRGVVDVQDYSDLDFFRSYDRDPRLHTLSNIYSSAYLTRNRPTYSLNVLADRRDILLGHATSDPASPILKQRFEQLPSLQLRMYPQRVANLPLYFSLESSASHLRTSGLVNGPTADYERADLFPTLSLQMRTPSWLSIKPQLSARETYYTSQLDANSITSINKTAIDQSLSRFYAQGQVEVVGPSLSRVFNDNIGGFTKFKHIIEPRFRFIYTTDVRDQNRVIRFDTVDTPFLPIVRDSVEYSLTQRLIGKEAGPNASPREILSFSLRQTVALSKPFTSATGGNLPGSTETPGSNQKFTPLVASLHVNPYQSITLDANATFGNLSHQIDQTSLSANLVGSGTNSDKYLAFTWFASFKQPPLQTGDSSQFRINTGSNLWHDRMHADVQLNYDAKKHKFLEERYLFGGTGSCYGIALEFRRYLVYTPVEKANSSIGIAVTLKNVGSIGLH